MGGFELGIERANNNKPSNEESQSSKQEEGTVGRIGNSDEQSVLLHSGSDSTTLLGVGFSEINKYASELLTQKFPNTKNFGDCTKINTDELPDFDFLCGGFPCQSFSIAGKRRGFEDTRGTMFFEIARILEAKRPKTLLLENVKGLLNHDKGETFKVILQTLDELGYETQWIVLNSKFFGVPQNRERVFIIGSLRGEPRPEILPFRESPQINTLSYAQGNDVAYCLQQSDKHRGSYILHNVYGGFKEDVRKFDISPTIRTPKGGGHLPMVVASRGRNPSNPSDRTVGNPTEQRLEPNSQGISNALSSVQKDNMVLENMKIRRLTPIECERLQGFPDEWTEGFSDTQRYRMMGNAVTVNVVQAIVSKMFANPKRGNNDGCK